MILAKSYFSFVISFLAFIEDLISAPVADSIQSAPIFLSLI